LEEPDVEVLDLGNPLVRRLVERVKQEAFRREDENYGRTVYLVRSDVEEVTVVFHLLERYVEQATGPVRSWRTSCRWPCRLGDAERTGRRLCSP
jgi:hypothetical protein